MAKQRHSMPNIDDNEYEEHTINFKISKKSSYSWLLYCILAAAILLIFVFNIFQFELLSTSYTDSTLKNSKNGDEKNGKSGAKKSVILCDYQKGPIFYNLKTSLGVSYDGSHW